MVCLSNFSTITPHKVPFYICMCVLMYLTVSVYVLLCLLVYIYLCMCECMSMNMNTILNLSSLKWINHIIIISSCHQHGYPWSSLTTLPYRSSHLAGLQGYTPYLHRAAVCRFELVALPLLIHVRESTGVHHLWARPYFSSSVPHVWFI